MKARILAVALAVALTPACGKKDDDKKAGNTADTKTEKTPDKKTPDKAAPASGPSAGFDLGALKGKLQGAWVVGGSSLGTKEAWEVKGDKVTIFNGKDEKTLDFQVLSPCTLKTTEKSADGSSSSTISVYAFDGDTLYKGLGSAGVRKDGNIVACMSGAVYTFAGGTCTSWKESMFGDGKWDKKDAECSLDKAGEVEKFMVSGPRGGELEAFEGIFATKQMQGNKAEKHPDLAAAKAALGG